MTWIKAHSELRDHPKRKRLSRILKLDTYQTIGLLNCLWWWVTDYAPDGDLSKYEAADIADGIDYSGDPDALLDALQSAGFIDERMVHDWYDYAGCLIEQRKANAERMKTKRAAHVQRTCVTREGLEREERVERVERVDKKEENICASDLGNAAQVFDHWKQVMGRNGSTCFDDKRKKAVKWVLKTYSIEDCLAAIDGYAASDWHMGRDPKTGGKKNNDLTLIFRDAEHAEKFMHQPKARSALEEIDRIWGGDNDDR